MDKKMDWFIILALASFLLAACAAAPQTGGPASTPVPTIKVTEAVNDETTSARPTQPPSQVTLNRATPAAGSVPEFAIALQASLAEELAVDAEQVVLKESSETMWPNSCLGVQMPGMMCADVMVPGYLLVFSTPQGDYEVRTNQDGTNYRFLPSAGGQSGIQGQVFISPNCAGPVTLDNPDCLDKPYQASVTVLDSRGNLVTTFESDSQGSFQVKLAPGSYTLQPQNGNPYPKAAEQTIIVQEGAFTPVTIHYDTGMR